MICVYDINEELKLALVTDDNKRNARYVTLNDDLRSMLLDNEYSILKQMHFVATNQDTPVSIVSMAKKPSTLGWKYFEKNTKFDSSL